RPSPAHKRGETGKTPASPSGSANAATRGAYPPKLPPEIALPQSCGSPINAAAATRQPPVLRVLLRTGSSTPEPPPPDTCLRDLRPGSLQLSTVLLERTTRSHLRRRRARARVPSGASVPSQ